MASASQRDGAERTLDAGLLTAAFELAAKVHATHLRKGSDTPYLSHLLGVAEMVLLFGGRDVEVAGALLHDAVEDGGGRAVLVDVEAACGAEVAAIVAACSDSTTDTRSGARKDPWLVRKRCYIDHLRRSNPPAGAVLVSACDKLHNLTSTRLDYEALGEDVWGRFKTGWAGQVWYYRRLLEVYRACPDRRVGEVADRISLELEALEAALAGHGYDMSDMEGRLEAAANREYLADLGRRWWSYAANDLGREVLDAAWSDSDSPVVLKAEEADLNVIVPPDQDRAAAVRRALPAGARHRWFRSMRSSQALAQSVFAGLDSCGALDVLAGVVSESGLPAFGTGVGGASLTMEKEVTWLGEPRPTSIDAWIETGDHVVAVECKLTEPEFGTCSRPRLHVEEPGHCDGSYRVQHGRSSRCSLTSIGVRYWDYVPDVFTWDRATDHDPCPLRVTYQLVRNVLAATVAPDGTADPTRGHALVVYDRRNPRYSPGGAAWQAIDQVQDALRHPGSLRVVSWQTIVEAFAGEAELAWLVEGLTAKYGIAAD